MKRKISSVEHYRNLILAVAGSEAARVWFDFRYPPSDQDASRLSRLAVAAASVATICHGNEEETPDKIS